MVQVVLRLRAAWACQGDKLSGRLIRVAGRRSAASVPLYAGKYPARWRTANPYETTDKSGAEARALQGRWRASGSGKGAASGQSGSMRARRRSRAFPRTETSENAMAAA